MNIRLPLLIGFFALLYFPFIPAYLCAGQNPAQYPASMVARDEKSSAVGEDPKPSPNPAVEEFEKEKLLKLKRSVGRRLITVPTTNPTYFYESPDALERRLNLKTEKEVFVIKDVVQDRLGSKNFYQVKFDSGAVGFLDADGNNLEIEIKRGNLISLDKPVGSKRKNSNPSRALASQAVELVKNHPTPTDSAMGKKSSVEMRMIEEKERFFSNLKWRYEAKEIGRNRYRITQNVREGAGPPLIRTWIVDLSTNDVNPENLAAKEMYR